MLNLEDYHGREQAFIKHKLLQKYLPDFAYRIGRAWDSIVYVDAFAGPWGTKSPDHADSSFGTAISELKRARLGLKGEHGADVALHAMLIEKDTKAFRALEEFGKKNSGHQIRIATCQGEFEDKIVEIEKFIQDSGNNPFRFVLLDPKGWAGLAMDRISGVLRNRSCEVLVNVMTSFLRRFLKEEDRRESYQKFFGRDGVREVVLDAQKEDRPDVLVREYSKSLKELCGFKYVSSCVVLNPERNDIHYFLVFGTNHHKGIQVFKSAEQEAAEIQNEVKSDLEKQRKEASTGAREFSFQIETSVVSRLRAKYKMLALESADSYLMTHRSALYSDLFCEAMAFPLVEEGDLLLWLDSRKDVRLELELGPSGGARKKPSPDKNDFVSVPT